MYLYEITFYSYRAGWIWLSRRWTLRDLEYSFGILHSANNLS